MLTRVQFASVLSFQGFSPSLHTLIIVYTYFERTFDFPGDPLPQGSSPEGGSSSESETESIDVSKYYITLKQFVNILREKYGLNITSPRYKRLHPRNKIVLMSGLIKALKKNWRKITFRP